MALRGFFENFRATVARKRAVASVKRAEKNLQKRVKRWEAKQMPGIKARSYKQDVRDMTTNQLKAYARELNAVRGDKIQAGGIAAQGGQLLPLDEYDDYTSLWTARENEKRQMLRKLKLKGVDQNPKLALLDIDPETGQLRPERGGNYVLQLYGQPDIPKSRETLERRITQMRKWKSIGERIEISNSNVARKLNVIDPMLLDKWNTLTDAQKQHLINKENIFDYLNAFTFSTKDSEVQAYWRQFRNNAQAKYDHIWSLLDEAATLEQEYPEG